MASSSCIFIFLFITCLHPFPVISIQRIIINYSSKNLSRVPLGLDPKTTHLDLSLNQIPSLSAEDFHCTSSLVFLNLSWNLLEDIDRQAFNHTGELESLDLSHNQLQNLSTQFYLVSLRRLRMLDLSSNLFSTLTMGSEFSTLKDLEWLGLSAKVITSKDLTSISNITFKTLFLDASSLVSYDEKSLTIARSEKITISLSGHPLLDTKLASDALMAFEEVELIKVDHEMKIIALIRSREPIRTKNLQISQMTTSWQVLSSSINLIIASSIQKLSFTDLTMTNMSGGEQLMTPRPLESFSTTRALVTTFLFDQKTLYDFFISMPAQKMSLTETPIIFMTCPRHTSIIQELDLSNCVLTENVFSVGPDAECATLTNLQKLVLKGNNLKRLGLLTSRIQLMREMESIDLSQNSLTYSEEQVTCAWPAKVADMDLSRNEFDDRVFKCLPASVQSLNLQRNRVTAIPSDVSLFVNLSTLDLTGNRLLDLPSCQSFPNLKKLLLRSNSIHSPTADTLQSCPLLENLDLSRNAFVCTCSLRQFASLLMEESRGLTILHWPSGYKCSDPESKQNLPIEDFHLPEISCEAWILAITILLPMITISCALSVACVRLDAIWYMKMMWNWTHAKHHALTTQTTPKELQKIHFHAFVSYSQKNADWIQSKFLPKLESESGLRVCHHERDFIPGRTIMQNILRCIEQSRKSVFLLSPHFVQSEWCHYELSFAEHQRLNRGSHSVLLVLLEPLPLYLIPRKQQRLRTMMKKRSYLEWPQEGAKQLLFWANLRAALEGPLAEGVESG